MNTVVETIWSAVNTPRTRNYPLEDNLIHAAIKRVMDQVSLQVTDKVNKRLGR